MKTVDFDDETTMLHANGDRTTSEKKSKHKHKEKKSKKKTKKEKGIRKDSRAVDIELNHRSTKRKRSESMDHEEKSGKNEQKKPKKSKKDKRKKEKRTRRDDGDDEEPSNVASTQRLVASSAIEFYDESLKEKVKLRTKIGIGDINEEKEDVLATGQNVLKKTTCVSEYTTRPRADSKNDDDNMASDNDRQKQQIINKLIKEKKQKHSLTLLLFYQYVEPKWDQSTYDYMLSTLQHIGTDLKLTGRMRVAREGLNCTLTGSHESIVEYCNTLRRLSPPLSESSLSWKGSDNTDNEKRPPKYPFENTEFKLTTDLPEAQRFPNLKVLKVVELVHYGLEGKKAPPIHKYHGTHLEPADYHKKIAEPNTVIIDVRNHYEAAIGRFVPPQEVEGQSDNQHQSSKHDKGGPSLSKTSTDLPPPKWLDPKMRKSTEFPQWLDRPETKEEMKGKQVLMVSFCFLHRSPQIEAPQQRPFMRR
jgi:predicted sulfurtransferase